MADPTQYKVVVLGRKHEFILHYYNMAVKDLERHLKLGWETIAQLSVALLLISSGYQGYIPLPIAFSGTFIFIMWGMSNLIDSNYWALRAIAFLSNVESVYLNIKERNYFNPYAGFHPPYKMLNSLKSQLLAVKTLLMLIFCYYHLDLFFDLGDGNDRLNLLVLIDSPVQFGLNLLPTIVISLLVISVTNLEYKRAKDYLNFMEECPGPGMLSNPKKIRDVDFTGDFNPEEIVSGLQIQSEGIEILNKRINKIKNIRTIIHIISGIIITCSVVFTVLNFSASWFQ